MLDGLLGAKPQAEETTCFMAGRRTTGEKKDEQVAHHPIGFSQCYQGLRSCQYPIAIQLNGSVAAVVVALA